MTDFSFSTATRIRFGPGVVSELASHSARLGQRLFVVTGANAQRTAVHVQGLPVVGACTVAGEPTFDDARRAVAAARDAGADHVLGIGGGAVLDLAKAVAILAVSDADPMQHAEVIGAGLALPSAALPWIAVPTTAGTGSEVTANAVLMSPEHGLKVSLRSPAMLADVALIDPALAVGCPPVVTAQSGMDALTQCLEPLTSSRANPMVDALAVAGLRAGARGLVRAVENGDDLAARTDMALCSLMGGLSLANAKLGAVHGFAGVLGGMTGAPHGAVCAALLLPVTAMNIAAMRQREPDNPALRAYAVAAEVVAGTPDLDALLSWLMKLEQRLRLPGLVVASTQREAVVEGSMRASSMQGNPIRLTREELLDVLDQATQLPNG